MVRTSTIIVIVMCTCLIAGGGLGAYYFKSNEAAAIEAKKARETSVVAEAAADAAELKAAMSKANTQTVKSEYQLAAEQLELAKAGAGVSKYSSDAEKSNAESILIIASRAFEAAAARLQEAERSELTDAEDLKTARDLLEATRVTLAAAEESARIISEGKDSAKAITDKSGLDVVDLQGQASNVISSGQTTAATIRYDADEVVKSKRGEADSTAGDFDQRASELYMIKPETCIWKRTFVDGRINVNKKCRI